MRICIIQIGGLGDVVHAMPVASALRRHWPDSHITWVVLPVSVPLLEPHPAADRVIAFHRRRNLAGALDLRRAMSGLKFDLAINLNIHMKSAVPFVLARAPERWTFGRDRTRDGVWLTGNRRLPARPVRHQQDILLEFVEVHGIDPLPIEWQLVITPAEREAQRRFVERLDGRRAVALVPCSSRDVKDWPADRYVDVVNAIEHDLGARAVLVGGPSDREVNATRLIEQRSSRAPIRMVSDDVRSLIWTLDACAAAVAPDTGPLHVARALGTPVIGLFGHTNPWRVGPYRAYEDLWIDMYTDPGAPPDPSHVKSKRGRMELIDPRSVIEKVERALTYDRVTDRAEAHVRTRSGA